MRVSAIIPCLNEEKTLGKCITKAMQAFEELSLDGEVVVGDNGSTDRSVGIARELGARVVHEAVPGYGAALQAAINGSTGEVLIMADADGSYSWSEISPFLEKIKEGYDLVMGNRFKGNIMPKAMPFLNRYLGNPVLSWLARKAFKAPVGDFHCGMRAFTREAYDKIAPRTQGMEFATEMVVKACAANLKITEVPITLYPDERSRPPHLRPFTDGWRHLRLIMTFAPNYLYIIPGLGLFALGLVIQAILIRGPIEIAGTFFGIHYLALGCLLSYVGFSVVNLGVLAKVVLASHLPLLADRLVLWLVRHFSLERGLMAGSTLLLFGMIIDLTLLWRKLTTDMPMEESIHVAFVATSAIAIAVNIILSSFIIEMIFQENRGRFYDR